MGRPRNPERDKSLERFLKSDGKATTKELSEKAGVSESRIRKWKSEDKWATALKNKPKKRGAQKGNKNAAGKTPAKLGNKNAVTHGAYVKVGIEDIDADKAQDVLRNIGIAERMTKELQALLLRRTYLEGLLQEYQEQEEKYYQDKIVHMVVPKGAEDKTVMKTIVKSSAFERRQKVEAELNRVDGRIIKQLDSMKSYELENRRIDIEERRLELAHGKATGVFNVDDGDDDGNEEVIDDTESEDV